MRLVKGKDYRELRRYKYQTLATIGIQTEIHPKDFLESSRGWVELRPDGFITIRKGYCWDGASGPTFDTASTMRASLVHDALYQLMREKLLDARRDRRAADELLRTLMVEDGARRWRANAWLWAVWRFAEGAAD